MSLILRICGGNAFYRRGKYAQFHKGAHSTSGILFQIPSFMPEDGKFEYRSVSQKLLPIERNYAKF